MPSTEQERPESELGDGSATESQSQSQSQPAFGDPLDARRQYMLTASKFGQAVGLCRYVAPKHLWLLLTGRIADERGESAACVHGINTEAHARTLYSARLGVDVAAAGFYVHTRLSFVGATPDGLIGETGLLEIKCPLHGIPASIPDAYMAQVQVLSLY